MKTEEEIQESARKAKAALSSKKQIKEIGDPVRKPRRERKPKKLTAEDFMNELSSQGFQQDSELSVPVSSSSSSKLIKQREIENQIRQKDQRRAEKMAKNR